MKLKFFEDQTALQEVIRGLPTRTIMWKPFVILMKCPERDEFVVLKSAYSDIKTRELPKESFESFNEIRDWTHENDDLFGKHLIIEDSLLNKRGREALMLL
ncbi:hypothetical protein ABHN03_04115 [Paenibacillus sp. NRS-1775]|uniref:hypothetical protein n=1 Tax=unclassified Paenibacillus TaxID=185978 RepID=UPI003D2C45F8